MFSLLTLLAIGIVSAQTNDPCLSSKNVECFNQLEEIQSDFQCGPASLSLNQAMGHMMPKDDKWMDCACGKLPSVIECLDTSNCPTFKKLADDFAGVVMHCGMPDHMHGTTPTSPTRSAASASVPSPSQTNGASAVFRFRAPLLCGLCLLVLV